MNPTLIPHQRLRLGPLSWARVCYWCGYFGVPRAPLTNELALASNPLLIMKALADATNCVSPKAHSRNSRGIPDSLLLTSHLQLYLYLSLSAHCRKSWVSAPPHPWSRPYTFHIRGKWFSDDISGSIPLLPPIVLSQMQIVLWHLPIFQVSMVSGKLSSTAPFPPTPTLGGPPLLCFHCILILTLIIALSTRSVFFFDEIFQTRRHVQKNYKKYPHPCPPNETNLGCIDFSASF